VLGKGIWSLESAPWSRQKRACQTPALAGFNVPCGADRSTRQSRQPQQSSSCLETQPHSVTQSFTPFSSYFLPNLTYPSFSYSFRPSFCDLSYQPHEHRSFSAHCPLVGPALTLPSPTTSSPRHSYCRHSCAHCPTFHDFPRLDDHFSSDYPTISGIKFFSFSTVH